MPLLNREVLLEYIEQMGQTDVLILVFLFLRAGGEIFVEKQGVPEGNLLKNLNLDVMPDDAGKLLVGSITDRQGMQLHGFLDFVVVSDPQKERNITAGYLQIITKGIPGSDFFIIVNNDERSRVTVFRRSFY